MNTDDRSADAVAVTMGGETSATAKPAAVVIENVTRDFPALLGAKQVRALDNVSLRITPGEVVGLLGPNGSGKTTLLKILLGLLPPTSGRAIVFDASSCTAVARARVGFLGETAAFPRFLSGRELVLQAARLHGLDAAPAQQRATELLAWAGLSDAADRPLVQYSSGMRQRAGLAQALVHDPDLLVLDEPTTGLDPLGVAEFGALVRDLAARGKTILLSSHHLVQVERVCDRVVILNCGAVVADRPLRRGTGLQARDGNDAASPTTQEVYVTDPLATGELESFFLRQVESPMRAGNLRNAHAAPSPDPQRKTQNPKRKTTFPAASAARIRAVAALTFREILRQRTPYLALFLAAALVLGAQFLRGFDFGRGELKFLAELGLGATSLFAAFLAVAVVAQSFAAELERGGAAWQLATPLGRSEFVFGKFLGAWLTFAAFLGVLLTLVAAQLAARAFELGVPFDAARPALAVAAVAQFAKLGVVLALTLLLASWVRTPLLVLGGGWLLIAACHLQPFAQHAWSHSTSPIARSLGAMLALVLPDLAVFGRDVGAIGGVASGGGEASLAWLLGYGAVYVAGLLGLACLIFRRREL